MSKLIPGILLVLSAMLCGSLQAQEIEPNNPCASAQDLGSPVPPIAIFGALDSTDQTPDVDFFRFSLPAGERLQADLEGASTNQGTLPDPFLGLFDSNCNLINFNDDSGSLNSRLTFDVPADGVFILGVTSCCDSDFIGGGFGSYRLLLSPLAAIGSIEARIVDANTGEGLSGFESPFANAQLLRCDPGTGCSEFVNYQQADGEGRILFATDSFGNLLTAGTYQVQASANGYEHFFGEPFEVAEGESRDLGDLALAPFQLIGSITGRAVDAVTGEPLGGFGPPYVVIQLERCEGGNCFVVAGNVPYPDGSFSFDGPLYFISPGTFRLRGFADDYRETVSGEFEVGAFEHVDTGDFPLMPFPIRFGAVQECLIPPGGGLCDYSIEVTNRGPDRYRGEAWSIVEVFSPDAARTSRFQVGISGADVPMPRRLNLGQGESRTLTFQLHVPAQVADGTFICATITVGREPRPQFDNQGDRFVFCSVKEPGGIAAMPAKEGRRHYRKFTGELTGELTGLGGRSAERRR